METSAYVEQHPYLFEGTLRENLVLGEENPPEDRELLECLENVGLNTLFAEREGLESQIQDRGRNLSVGERYRVGLCRAMLLKRPFLLLDEPFAALDEESVRKVEDCLNRLRRSMGIALVTHLVPDDLGVSGMISVDGQKAQVHNYGATHDPTRRNLLSLSGSYSS